MKIDSIHSRLFREGENLETFVSEHLPHLKDGDMVVVTSKIVALSEGRVVALLSDTAYAKLIKRESEWALKTRHAWLTIKDGMFAVAAGIDASNAAGKLILLPKDSFKTASNLRKALLRRFGISKLGIIITDSRTLSLRAGAVGVAVGYAGFSGVRDYRGTFDLFGRKLRVTKANIADSLAAAAVAVMGEGAEQTPLALIRQARVTYLDHVHKKELVVPVGNDLFAPLFSKITRVLLKRAKR